MQLFKLIDSSVGQKFIAGATGIALVGFLVVHMAGNLQIFAGSDALNANAELLKSSAAAQIGLANHEAIAAAKAGVIGLTLSAAASYANRGIRYNAVAPGLFKSNMTRKLWETDEAEAMSLQMHAMGRLGNPEDIASAIAFLLDPANNWVTGQTLGVDGGLGSVLARMKM